MDMKWIILKLAKFTEIDITSKKKACFNNCFGVILSELFNILLDYFPFFRKKIFYLDNKQMVYKIVSILTIIYKESNGLSKAFGCFSINIYQIAQIQKLSLY